ncbi:MAG TPA: cell division protein ZapA [Dissulfurispiraceae bacterium]|nr:cell division protein ZapA [Dissulfurispiraceae bacterium]
MHSVEITILGQKYVIKGDSSPEHMEKVAGRVHAELQGIYGSFPSITPLRATILAALNIADELCRTKEHYASMADTMKSLEVQADSMIKMFE